MKHDGDIRIEIIEKGSNIYQPLPTQNAPIISTAVTSIVDATENIAMKSQNTEKEPLTSKTATNKQYPIIIPVIKDANKATGDLDNKKNPSDVRVNIEPRNMIISLLTNANNRSTHLVCNPIALVANNTQNSDFRCKLCNFEAINEFILSQHVQSHLSEAISTRASEPQTVATIIDLDDTISINKVPNKNAASEIVGDTSGLNQTTNSKQILKIQELRNLANRSESDRAPLSPDASVKEEKCPHCPFTTNKSDILKEHMQYHICVSGHVNLVNCDFCDFSIADESMLAEHSKIHFGLIKSKQKSVAFYTSYDNLEITTMDCQNNNDNQHPNQYAVKTLYPKINNFDLQYSSDKENKILVDVDTGQILK